MKKKFGPRGISLIPFPVTAANRYNAKNQPSVELGARTPFEVLDRCTIGKTGPACCVGSSARFIGVAKAFIRRSGKPFLLIGSDSDRRSALSALKPDWFLERIQPELPQGSGAIFLEDGDEAYIDLCERVKQWSEERFVIIHLGTGLTAGFEMIDKLKSAGQSLILCDQLQQSLRDSENREFSSSAFLKKMNYLFVVSAGVDTKCLKELLPNYQYMKTVNLSDVNFQRGEGGIEKSSRGSAVYQHRNHGGAFSQSRTLEPAKSVFEEDELQRIFENGSMLVYNAVTNKVFVADIVN